MVNTWLFAEGPLQRHTSHVQGSDWAMLPRLFNIVQHSEHVTLLGQLLY
jgi:hypothetical protein